MEELPKRKPLRLPGYDYRQGGCYFVTICTCGRCNFFWKPVGADIIRPEEPPLSAWGQLAEQAIRDIPAHYPQAAVEMWAVMPNHVHVLLRMEGDGGRMVSAPTKSLSTVIGQMKRAVSLAAGRPAWQKGFYEHVVRNEKDFLDIRTYIATNPAKWAEDCYYMEDHP